MSDSNGGDPLREPEGPANQIDTEYEVGQDNITPRIGPLGLDIHNPVFVISGLSVVVFVLATLAFQNSIGPVFLAMRDTLTASLDWFFLMTGNIFVLLCLGLLASPLGRVRIGGRDASPDYGYWGWFAMLFAAGMGIGLMFFGVAEPMGHFDAAFGGIVTEGGVRTDGAPLGGAAGDVDAARLLAMAATIYHWGLHPWAIYAVVALSMALFTYNKGLPLTMRSIFHPIFGERIWGWPGHVIDILAVFATLFGLATSLGIGAQQANAGLSYMFGIEIGTTAQVVLIVGITLAALVSVLRGLDGGVKRLSELNLVLAAVLLVFLIVVGPTVAILTGFIENVFAYGREIVALSNPFGREDDSFRQGWTAFYWAWWISWSPFVGMFIARVSRGRTVREFITCVLLIPTLVSVLWMTTMGGTGLSQLVDGGFTGVQEAALELKLFEMLSQLPLATISSFLAFVLVIMFFVTSSDSGSLVIDAITAGGKIDAPVSQRVFWVGFEGLVAAALLIGGGLGALQAMAVSTGFPFAIVLLFACYALVRGLLDEPR